MYEPKKWWFCLNDTKIGFKIQLNKHIYARYLLEICSNFAKYHPIAAQFIAFSERTRHTLGGESIFSFVGHSYVNATAAAAAKKVGSILLPDRASYNFKATKSGDGRIQMSFENQALRKILPDMVCPQNPCRKIERKNLNWKWEHEDKVGRRI